MCRKLNQLSRVYRNSFCITASMNVNSVSGCYQSFPTPLWNRARMRWEGVCDVLLYKHFVEYIIYYFARKNWDGGLRRKTPYLRFLKQWKKQRCVTVLKCTHLYLFISHPLSPSKMCTMSGYLWITCHTCRRLPFPVFAQFNCVGLVWFVLDCSNHVGLVLVLIIDCF